MVRIGSRPIWVLVKAIATERASYTIVAREMRDVRSLQSGGEGPKVLIHEDAERKMCVGDEE